MAKNKAHSQRTNTSHLAQWPPLWDERKARGSGGEFPPSPYHAGPHPPFSSWEDATALWGPGSARHHQNVRASRLTTWSWSLTSSRSHWGCWRTPPSAWPARPSSPWQCRKQWRTLSDLRANDKWVGTNVSLCFLSLALQHEWKGVKFCLPVTAE